MKYILFLSKRITSGIIIGIGIGIGFTFWLSVSTPSIKTRTALPNSNYMPDVSVVSKLIPIGEAYQLEVSLTSLGDRNSSGFQLTVELNDENHISYGWCNTKNEVNIKKGETLTLLLNCVILPKFNIEKTNNQYLIISSGFHHRKMRITSVL